MVPQYGASALLPRRTSPTPTPAPGPFHVPRSTSVLPDVPVSVTSLQLALANPGPPLPCKTGPKKPPRSETAMQSFMAVPPPMRVPSVSIYSPMTEKTETRSLSDGETASNATYSLMSELDMSQNSLNAKRPAAVCMGSDHNLPYINTNRDSDPMPEDVFQEL